MYTGPRLLYHYVSLLWLPFQRLNSLFFHVDLGTLQSPDNRVILSSISSVKRPASSIVATQHETKNLLVHRLLTMTRLSSYCHKCSVVISSHEFMLRGEQCIFLEEIWKCDNCLCLACIIHLLLHVFLVLVLSLEHLVI